jgi:hypothetical protein
MKSTTEKSSTTTSTTVTQAANQPFFARAGGGNFVAPSAEPVNAGVQMKLAVGKPGDRFEKEADSMAERVVQKTETPKVQQKCAECEGGDSAQRKPLADSISPFVQRQALQPAPNQDVKEQTAQTKSEGDLKEEKPVQKVEEKEEPAQAKSDVVREDEKPLQKAEDEGEPAQAKSDGAMEEEKPVQKATDEEEPAQAKAANGSAPATTPSVESALSSSKGQGSPLPDSTRSGMESGFGVDFGNVRIHTGSAAVGMSKGLHAQAFTHGSDIYFNEGKFNPATTEGKTLLAHELTHTIQQGAVAQRKPEEAKAPGTLVQREEENVDLQKELEASDKAAKEAIDPGPARKTRAEAIDIQADTAKKAQSKHAGKKGSVGKKAGRKPGASAVSKKARAAALAAKEEIFKQQLGAVGKDLSDASAFACAKADQKAGDLAENEQTHDDAAQKQNQTDAAVEPPTQEGQAMSNTEQVEGLDAAPPPRPDKEAARRTMTNALGEAMPTSIEEVNEFESKGKAQVVGNEVLGSVTEDVSQVQDKYNDIEQPPAPKPTEESTALPPTETAPGTPALNLGRGAVPNLKPQHTDVKAFDKQSDDLLQKEGISEEQLNMVDSGDLADAKKERQGLKKKVAEEPLKIQQEAQKQTQQVEKSLQQDENQGKALMRQKRNSGLNATRDKQQKTKSALEKKREEVTNRINGIYERAKKSVTDKLGNLEKQNLRDFDAGQQSASVTFEREVKRDINAWKRERYSGIFGGVKWLKDKIVGIDHFPEVQQALTRGRENYIKRIDALIVSIDQANQQVIRDCKLELANARKEIQNFVKNLGPELRSTGQQAMKDMQTKLAEMDKFIDDQKNKLREKLCSKREEAIKKIDEKIEKMKEEMSGLLSKLGNLILEALLKFFKWALEKAGYSPQQLMAIVDKGKAVVKKIVTSPGEFFGNLAAAVKGGVESFKNNIKKHLIAGVVGWLTGAMSDAGLQLPTTWDIKGIFFLLLQILNLTKEAILKKLSDKVGRPIVEAAMNIAGFVKRVMDEGPMALWDMLMEQAESLKEKVMETIRNWITVEMIKQGLIKLVSMLNPVGAIVQLIIGIYNAVMFFIENWSRIVEFVKTIFNSIADIAFGRLGGAMAAVERALAMTIPIILNFIARMLNLSGIGKAIRKAIEAIRAPIDKIVDKGLNIVANVVRKLVAKVKGLVMKGKEKVVKGVKAIINWLKFKKQFSTDSGEKHTLHFKGKGNNYDLMVASAPIHITTFLNNKKTEINSSSTLSGVDKSKMLGLIGEAEAIVNEINGLTNPSSPPQDSVGILEKKMNTKMNSLAQVLKKIDINAHPVPPLNVIPGFSTNQANQLKVNYLLRGFHEPGSEASEYSGDLRGALSVLKSLNVRHKWVAFHLLNHNTGGKAVDSNLTPIPQTENKQFERNFESDWKKKYTDNKVLWMNVTLSYRDSMFLKRIVVTGGEMKFEKKRNKWEEDDKNKLPSWSANVPPPELASLLINHLPSDEDAIGQVAKLVPIEKGNLILLNQIKPRIVSSKETLIRITESALSQDSTKREKVIKQIKATPMDFS